MKRASADVGSMFIAYNLRRLMNIIDKNDLKKFLQELAFIFYQILASLKAIIFKMRLYPYKLVSLPIGLTNALELPLKNLFLGRTEVLRRTAVVCHTKPFNMKIQNLILLLLVFSTSSLKSQDGKLLNLEPLILHDSIYKKVATGDSSLAQNIKEVQFFKISYLSDGLKVTGYIARPRTGTKYPCIISNRGGNRDFGQWEPLNIAFFLGRMASWNYVVIATQYRGIDGGEGREEFGGKDVNDVLNLVPVLSQIAEADTTRIGMEGTSRGGMMTYLSLAKTCKFKAAAITAGVTNAFVNIATRPEMDTFVYSQLIPNYTTNKEEALKERSAVFWADKLCKSTPLLIMHGSADWRVRLDESLELIKKLYELKHPVRYIIYEGAEHGIREFRSERFAETKRHFDYYVRDGKKWPNMELHGP